MTDAATRPLSRWANEGGAIEPVIANIATAPMSQSELTQLRIRTIALENVVIALLEAAPDDQRAAVRELAQTIAPRSGSTPHPLTESAALHMNHLVDRAEHFRRLR